MADDPELLRQYARDGSEEAFTELVRRHLNLVYSAALRRVGGDAHLAEDVAQQVFVALARQAGALSGHPILTGWLYTTARFASARVVRAERRRQIREQAAHLMHDLASPSAPDPDWDRLRPVLDEVMDQLVERDREALLLRFFEGRTFAALSLRLGLTEEAARKRVDRALEKLRVLLARRGVSSSTVAVALMLESQAVTAAPAGLVPAVAGSALSAAGSATGSIAVLFQIMSNSKIVASLMVCAAFLTVGTATYEVYAVRDTNVALATSIRDNAGLLRQLNGMEQRTRTAGQEVADLRKSVEAARATRVAEEAEAARIQDPAAAGREFLAAHPEAKGVLISYQRAQVLRRYNFLFQSLGLSSAQIDQVLDLLVQDSLGLRWNSTKQAPLIQFNVETTAVLSREEREAQLHVLLGDSGYRQYQEFNRTEAALQLAGQFGRTTYFAETPLTPTQAGELARIFTESSPEYRQGKSVDRSKIDWDAALLAAQTVLSGRQLAALGDFRQQMQYQLALDRRARTTMDEALKASWGGR